MLIKICSKPSCKKENTPDKIYCQFCGTRLPSVLIEKPPVGPPLIDPPDGPSGHPAPSGSVGSGLTGTANDLTDERQAALNQETTQRTTALPLQTTQHAAELEQLATQHAAELNQQAAQYAATNDQVVAEHAALVAEHQQLKQDHDAVIDQTGTLWTKLSTLEQEVLRIPGLEKALEFAKAEAEHFRTQPLPATDSHPLPDPIVVTKVVTGLSTLQKVIVGALPIVTAVGGLFAGVHTPLNTYKAQLEQTQAQVQATVRKLNSTAAEDAQTKAAKQALEQQKEQLAGQLATDAAQQAQQTQASQSTAAQLAATQRDLQSTRASLTRITADLAQTRQQKEASDQRAVQIQAESTRKGSQLEAAQKVMSTHPLLSYHGPMEGTFTISYNAKNDKPANITIDHQRVSGDGGLAISTVAGSMLPGVPVVVQASGAKRASIADSPGPNNGWAKLTIRVEGKDQHQALVHWSVPQ